MSTSRRVRRYTRSSASTSTPKGAPLAITYRQQIDRALNQYTVRQLAAMLGDISASSILRALAGTPVSHESAMRFMMGLPHIMSTLADARIEEAEAETDRLLSSPIQIADDDDVMRVATLVAEAEEIPVPGPTGQRIRERAERVVSTLMSVVL